MSSFGRSYTPTAKALHWAMAALIVVAAIIGIYGAVFLHYGVDDAQTALKIQVITLHKNIATTTLFLIALRIVWRLTHQPPELKGMSPVMVKAAHAGHAVLYVLMVLVPVSGWANSSAAGYPIPVAGLFQIPHLVEPNKALTPTLSALHEYLAYALLVIVAGHIAAALKHRFIDKDDVLASMLPGK
ncbi:cytochrome b561 [Rhodoblastus acidophilus]|uniref:cytochrome b n=1 Tax=Rhodoblastus acidophilus TaxID=1074 RepID=UPI0022243F7F|nr:cytochrome b [Rhodoblastus acidophilus]MCW2315489.1 cytochrome b561 [Rhodoblastus acidophilus]